MKFPDLPKSGFPIAQTIGQIIRYLRSSRVVSINGIKGKESPNGTSFVIPVGSGGGKTKGGSTGLCPFGELETWQDGEDTLTGIRGGIVYCGDKNFNVPRKEINLASDSDSLIYLEIACEANRDDDNELILSGIKTSSETNPATFWKDVSYAAGPPVTQYPDNDNPTVSTGIGKIIIPIGRLIVLDDAATLTPAACGNVIVSQCAGTLSQTRA